MEQEINKPYGLEGCTPLTLAVNSKNSSQVKQLIEEGSDVNEKDKSKNFWSPLMWAVAHGHAEIVKILIEKGADVNAKSNSDIGETALMLAAYHRHTFIVKILIEKGADVNAKDSAGTTPLMSAIASEFMLGIASVDTEMTVKLLIEKGADISAKHNNGMTALDFARREKLKKIIKGDNAFGESGCFIATATMGDYGHPAVITLREFRDEYLEKRGWGRAFTRLYYKHAPFFARIIEKHSALRRASYALIIIPLVSVSKRLLKSESNI